MKAKLYLSCAASASGTRDYCQKSNCRAGRSLRSIVLLIAIGSAPLVSPANPVGADALTDVAE